MPVKISPRPALPAGLASRSTAHSPSRPGTQRRVWASQWPASAMSSPAAALAGRSDCLHSNMQLSQLSKQPFGRNRRRTGRHSPNIISSSHHVLYHLHVDILIVWPFCLVHVMGCAFLKALLLRIDNLSISTLTGFAGTTLAGRYTKQGMLQTQGDVAAYRTR